MDLSGEEGLSKVVETDFKNGESIFSWREAERASRGQARFPLTLANQLNCGLASSIPTSPAAWSHDCYGERCLLLLTGQRGTTPEGFCLLAATAPVQELR